MKKIILNLAVSLDGFIARKNDLVDWLDNLDTDGSDLGFGAFLDRCDTLIMGRASYETTLKLGNGVWPFNNHSTYVFTSKEQNKQHNVTFSNQEPITVIKKLQQQSGKHIWLFGGGRFIQYCREHNLIDEYIITYIPVMIGNGIPLFNDVNNENTLTLKQSTKVKNILTNHYIVDKKA